MQNLCVMGNIKRYSFSFKIIVLYRFNDTFNNISVLSWRLVLLMEEIGVARENHQPVASH